MEELRLEKISETLSVYQKSGVFCYGTDAVVLANYVKDSQKVLDGKSMCDLGTGTGIVPLMLCDAAQKLNCTCLEINSEACKIAAMSAGFNGYGNRFSVINGDIKNVRGIFRPEQFDFITCNPPYMTQDCGRMCDTDYKTIARHEVLCSIGDVFSAAFYLLRTGASLYIVYRSDRLASLFKAANDNRFQIKRMTAVTSKDLPSIVKLIVCEAKKDAAEGLIFDACSVNKICNK